MFTRSILSRGTNRILSRLRTEDYRTDPLISLVRWRRPPWAPLRASKLFRVRVKPVVDPDEVRLMKKTNDHYKAELRSLRSFIQEELEAKAMVQSKKDKIDVEEEFKQSVKENILFNSKSASLRAMREIEEKKLKEDQELNLLLEMEKTKQEQLEAARHEVIETIDKSKEFISLDNLESAIEEALNTRHVYNFSIDTEGRRFIEQEDGSTVVVEPNDSQKTDRENSVSS